MPTNYPGGLDNFTEPSDPENTPLSSAGTGTRNHSESHVDMGDAIEALQIHASKKTHKHTGTDDSEKLDQANTHQNADTDSGATAIHHTLGKGANQAARGNHTHDYNAGTEILNAPWRTCTTTTRPVDPFIGMTIYETDTHTVRVWDRYLNEPNPRWVLLPAGNVPIVQVRQNQKQRIPGPGTILEWHVEEEDSFGSFDPAVSLHNIVIKESGSYQIDVSVAWDPQELWSNIAFLGVVLNGELTSRIVSQYVVSNLFNAELSQTIEINTAMRLQAGDVISIRAWHRGGTAFWTFLNTTQTMSRRDTRLTVRYASP
jgi:hypothetical protein